LLARLGGFMTSLLSAFDRTVRRLTSAAVAIAAALILLVAVLISADVASQAIFQAPIPVVTELASAMLGVIIFMALGFAQYRRQNVQVDVVILLVSPRTRDLLDRFSLLISTTFFLLLAWRSIALAQTSWETRETAMALIAFPVYPFKIGAAIGAAIASAENARQLIAAFGLVPTSAYTQAPIEVQH
jgi:TRAP-type C4-dicarboxylate transport system permease small subunit